MVGEMKIPKGWQTQSKPVARSAPRQSKVKVPSAGEAVLCRHLDALKIDYEQEFKFHPVRKWRADFLISGYPILVECEGGIWSGANGGHTSGKGYTANCEKYSVAATMGYFVIRATTDQVKSGECIKWIEDMIKHIDENR